MAPPPDSAPNRPRASHVDASSGNALWARVKAVFLEALDRPASERATFLRDACAGDPRLRDEVQSLLESEAAASSLWESPAVHLLSEDDAPEMSVARPRLQPGMRLGSYEIGEFIAAGGMGEVYRARHTILGRDVAIKTLGTASDLPARRRLIREARHASVLSHPNICTIYEVGDSDDGPFIVMQHAAGRTLGAIIRAGLPTIDVAITYAMQIADALDHAHAHGIVHRDLKSSNVVVTADDRPIVLDFGLAKRLPATSASQSADQSLTAHDRLAGTLSHMAPEVLLGALADVRSDIWSLGVLMYELVTGQLPFAGRTPYETSSAILGEPPRPMGSRVPLALRLVIERCLAKEPDRRYQHVGDVLGALDAIKRRDAWPLIGRLLISVRRGTLIATGSALLLAVALAFAGIAAVRRFTGTTAGVSTLALLPLENATGDPGVTYYADGITEALIAQLGAASNARVISRASAARVATHAKSIREAGTQLRADALVQGAVRKAGDRVEVDVRLIDPATNRILWSDVFERDARDVLALEADVIHDLAAAVRLTLRPDARDRLAVVRAVTPVAYEEYLKGRYEWNSRTPKSLQAAIDHFTRAIALDPTYAPAHAALADCYNQLGTVIVGTGSPQQWRPRAAAEAIKALQLDPYSAEAHAALGYVDHYNWEWGNAENEFRRAIELNPNYSLVRIWYANLLMSRKRMPEAVQQALIARDVDPFSLIVNTNVGWVLDFAGRHEDAVRQLRQTIALDSTYVQAHWRLADALMHAGRLSEAVAEGEHVLAISGRSTAAVGLLVEVYAKAGEPDRSRALGREMLARARTEYVSASSISGAFLALGETDSAMTWLEKAFDERSNAIAYLVVNPSNAPLYGDPRFEAMVARVGLK